MDERPYRKNGFDFEECEREYRKNRFKGSMPLLQRISAEKENEKGDSFIALS